MDKKNQPFSWRARARSFRYAIKGIATLFREEHNARIHCVVMCLVILAGFIFGISSWEWCAVLLSIGGVLMAESINSAIESLCDKVSPGADPMIGKAKDLASAAVLLFVLCAVGVGIIVFLPRMLSILEIID